jgi:hypothetical protein
MMARELFVSVSHRMAVAPVANARLQLNLPVSSNVERGAFAMLKVWGRVNSITVQKGTGDHV